MALLVVNTNHTLAFNYTTSKTGAIGNDFALFCQMDSRIAKNAFMPT